MHLFCSLGAHSTASMINNTQLFGTKKPNRARKEGKTFHAWPSGNPLFSAFCMKLLDAVRELTGRLCRLAHWRCRVIVEICHPKQTFHLVRGTETGRLFLSSFVDSPVAAAKENRSRLSPYPLVFSLSFFFFFQGHNALCLPPPCFCMWVTCGPPKKC